MTIGEQLEKNQPIIYNFLIDLFGLSMKKTLRIEPVEEDEEDSYQFRYYRKMMNERKGVEL